MFKLTLQYFNRYDDRLETTVHGTNKKEAYKKAYDRSLKDGDGEFCVVSMYNLTKI